jgi:hypothetical protein
MIELVRYLARNGERWRFALINTDSIAGMVALERETPAGEWVHVMDVCGEPSEIGIEIGIEPHERDKVLNQKIATHKLAVMVERYVARQKKGRKP